MLQILCFKSDALSVLHQYLVEKFPQYHYASIDEELVVLLKIGEIYTIAYDDINSTFSLFAHTKKQRQYWQNNKIKPLSIYDPNLFYRINEVFNTDIILGLLE